MPRKSSVRETPGAASRPGQASRKSSSFPAVEIPCRGRLPHGYGAGLFLGVRVKDIQSLQPGPGATALEQGAPVLFSPSGAMTRRAVQVAHQRPLDCVSLPSGPSGRGVDGERETFPRRPNRPRPGGPAPGVRRAQPVRQRPPGRPPGRKTGVPFAYLFKTAAEVPKKL